VVVDPFSRTWPIVRFGDIDSTNEEARRRASAGDMGPCWLVADAQSAGRGRLGRIWSSPKGNLFATALLAYPRAPSEAALACFAAGLAVLDAAERCRVDMSSARLKWPNDVMVGAAKLSGILIETGHSNGHFWMAAGFGVNVASAPERPERPTVCLADLPGGAGLSADQVLSALDMAFRMRLYNLLSEGFEPTRRAWLARAALVGARIELLQPGNHVEGLFTGLGEDGALMLERSDGSIVYVRAGEIASLDQGRHSGS
jgi:BirA family biotin operon repressor/biotin-[acetyl-CoA-carboxylase] ligase